jgi:hypothetical protein
MSSTSGEINQLLVDDDTFVAVNFISEWVRYGNTSSIIFSVKSDSLYSIVVEYAINNDFDIVDSETFINTVLNKTETITLQVRSRYMRFSVLDLTNPCVLKCQGFYFSSPLDSTKKKNEVVVSNLPISAFGSVDTTTIHPMHQYLFNKGVSGSLNTGAWAIPYSDIKGFANGPTTFFQFSNGCGGIGYTNLPNETAIIQGGTFSTPFQNVVCRFSALYYQSVKIAPDLGPTTQYVGMGSSDLTTMVIQDGFFFGYADPSLVWNDPDSFGIIWINRGVRTFIPRTEWNLDKANGTGVLPDLNWGYLNVFQIKGQCIGGGAISFHIEDPISGLFVTVHKIRYANTSFSTSLGDPGLGMVIYQKNEPGSVQDSPLDVTLSGSFMIGIQGLVTTGYDRFSVDNEVMGVTTEASIISIRNNPIFYGTPNHLEVSIDFLSVSGDNGKPTIIRVYRNPTIIAPTWVSTYTNLIPVDKDITGTFGGLGNGVLLYTFELGKENSFYIKLHNLHTYLLSGDTITMTATTTVSADFVGSLGFHRGR